MAATVILLEAHPRHPATGATVAVRLAGGGGDRPYFYDGQHWRAGLTGLPTAIARLDFDGQQLGSGGVPQALELAWAPASNAAVAELGALYWGDAAVTLRIGPEGDTLPPVAAAGLVLDAAADRGVLTIAFADLATDLKRPLLVDRFAGTGGLEGPPEWQGQIKPRGWGACFNVPGKPLLRADNIWCFGDPLRPWQAFRELRDKGVAVAAADLRGVAWQGSAAATLAALQAAVVPAGGCVVCPSIACVKWWTAPAGDPHADIEGESDGGYVATAPEIVARIVAARSTLSFAPGEVATAAAARPAPFGRWWNGESVTAIAAITELLGDVGLSWVIEDGAIAFREWVWGAPVRTARSVTVTRRRIVRPLATRRLGFRRNHAPMARGDLADIVLATNVAYGDGTTAEAWRPAEPGADSTKNYVETSRYRLGEVVQAATETRRRFAPLFWTTNFPATMIAAVHATSDTGLRIDATFLERGHLAGLIWASEDTLDHPTTAYRTDRDYRGCVLEFDLALEGDLNDLSSIDGPTLTVEGRDAAGQPQVWYVRLANATRPGAGARAARIRLDFDRLPGGFYGNDSVYAGDVDRLLLSFVPSQFEKGSATPLAQPAEAALVISNMAVSGSNDDLVCGTGPGGVHEVRMANGYDDTYNVAPARIVRNLDLLGYTGEFNHYVGMSHYPRWRWSAAEKRYIVDASAADPLNLPCRRWHEDLAARLHATRRELIVSLSYELLDSLAPAAWRQADAEGAPALTGWTPPSTLLSPCNDDAAAYLKSVARAFCAIAAAAGLRVRFQVGEPWYWIDATSHVPCFYDAATVARWTGDHGAAPPRIATMRDPLSAAQLDFLDWLGDRLAASILALHQAVRDEHPAVVSYALLYLPQLLDERTPEAHRVNMPAGLAFPALDILQLEDYDFIIGDRPDLSASARAAIERKLGYPRARQEYFGGFAADRDAGPIWRAATNALADASDLGVARLYIWAYTQVCRDGYVPRLKSRPALQLADLRDVAVPTPPHAGAVLGWDADRQRWTPRDAVPAPAPQVATLTAPWSDDPDAQGARFFRDGDGTVTLEGMVRAPAGTPVADVTLFALPPGYRPAARVTFAIWTASGTARADVEPGGAVVARPASVAGTSLAGIRFLAATGARG